MAFTGKNDERTEQVIRAALDVHHELGPGFLESAYLAAMQLELERRDVPCEREVQLAIRYKGGYLPVAYRADLVCYDDILVEGKAVTELHDVHSAQVIHYLKASGLRIGLLLNFGEARLAIRRFANLPGWVSPALTERTTRPASSVCSVGSVVGPSA